MKTLFLTAFMVIAIGTMTVVEATAQTVEVGINKEQRIGKTKLRIKFIEVIEDSRCPTDVDCIWAGNAKIKLRVISRGISRVLTLNTMNAENVETVHGYKFRLTGLAPAPRSNIKINSRGYVAAIEAEKVGK